MAVREESETFAGEPTETSTRSTPRAVAQPLALTDVLLTLNPSEAVVRPGTLFEVALKVEAALPVSHLPATLSYDPELLELVSTQDGGFLGAGGAAEILSDTSVPGRIVLGASRLGTANGVMGRGTLYKMRFRALRLGEGQISFLKSNALDALLGSVTLATSPALVSVQRGAFGAPVPPTGPSSGATPALPPSAPDDIRGPFIPIEQ